MTEYLYGMTITELSDKLIKTMQEASKVHSKSSMILLECYTTRIVVLKEHRFNLVYDGDNSQYTDARCDKITKAIDFWQKQIEEICNDRASNTEKDN